MVSANPPGNKAPQRHLLPPSPVGREEETQPCVTQTHLKALTQLQIPLIQEVTLSPLQKELSALKAQTHCCYSEANTLFNRMFMLLFKKLNFSPILISLLLYNDLECLSFFQGVKLISSIYSHCLEGVRYCQYLGGSW